MKIKNISNIKGTLPVRDPFIMTASHYDIYPAGNGKMGPKEYLPGTQLGSDFNPDAKWRMYHGDKVPGFPQHPHRGFEIITIIPEGYADHFDSKGSKGRYGNGDVQIMIVGRGLQHSEMFPLVHEDKENPLRLFQIWLNLPAKSKLTNPEYKMIWKEQIPIGPFKGGRVQVIVGNYLGVNAIPSFPQSWSAPTENHVGVALIELEANAKFELPAVSSTLNRFLYYYEGNENVIVAESKVKPNQLVDLNGNEVITIETGEAPAKFLLLEGEPINEPVAAYGPFVMNTQRQLVEGFEEFRQTQFGGWPWGEKEEDILNPKEASRFASYDFGKVIDTPPQAS